MLRDIYAVLRALIAQSKSNSHPGVHGVVEPLQSIPNSAVKRNSGDDIWGAAPRENSSMPGQNFLLNTVCMH